MAANALLIAGCSRELLVHLLVHRLAVWPSTSSSRSAGSSSGSTLGRDRQDAGAHAARALGDGLAAAPVAGRSGSAKIGSPS